MEGIEWLTVNEELETVEVSPVVLLLNDSWATIAVKVQKSIAEAYNDCLYIRSHTHTQLVINTKSITKL